MKIQEIIRSFSEIGSDESEREAYLTVEYLFGVSYASALSDKSRDYDGNKIKEILEKRKQGVPLQYIFGEWYFMGEKFYVSEDCLIPRADTELLAEHAVKLVKHGGRVADLCTGSGCIGVSLAILRPDLESVELYDISEGALSVAKRNIHLHRLDKKCRTYLSDVREQILDGKYDMIVSNPPYILKKDMDSLSKEVKNEPYLALCGGDDGLDIIRPIVENSACCLNEGGYLMIEFGYDQMESMDNLLSDATARGLYSSYKILYDYGNNPRMCIIVK